jgi:hypothetical protein
MRFVGWSVDRVDGSSSMGVYDRREAADEWCERLRGYGNDVHVVPFEVPDEQAVLSGLLRDMARRVSEQRREALHWYVRSQRAEQFLRYAPIESVTAYREQMSAAFFNREEMPPVPDGPIVAGLDGDTATPQPSDTGWIHEDGSACPVFLADRPFPEPGMQWWCTEHQQHVHRDPANPLLTDTPGGDR